mmetsp:Transcript_8966/g.24853  ORF Transcript_8966/g.24853 Transcript_8966/m.24853 type:complete len:529 (-) Transcript_8966:40-1626(-)
MADVALFVSGVVAALVYGQRNTDDDHKDPGNSNKTNEKLDNDDASCTKIQWVDPSNNEIIDTNETIRWHRASYALIMHEPPELYYEPRDWAHSTVLLSESKDSSSSSQEPPTTIYSLTGGVVRQGESCRDCAMRHLATSHQIDVAQPENCLHHLFTFPLQYSATTSSTSQTVAMRKEGSEGLWGDFYECIFRGSIADQTTNNLQSFSLAELKQLLIDRDHSNDNNPDITNQQYDSSSSRLDSSNFTEETVHALKLYFQRQGDLRAKRRLLKGYSKVDLAHYGLRDISTALMNQGSSSFQSSSGSTSHHGDILANVMTTNNPPATSSTPQPSLIHSNSNRSTNGQEGKVVVFLDANDSQRQQAVDFTLKTDDGQCPRLWPQADLILLGVSRTGKSPLSLYIAQTSGLQVTNVPLALQELPPPALLLDDARINPKRVFCLTMDAPQLQALRLTRFRREMKQQIKAKSRGVGGRPCSYASADYVKQDLDKARELAREHGFTELNMTNRAMEETAYLIVSKLKERFSDLHIL